MSLTATRWAWVQCNLRPLHKLVLLALADRSDTSNKAFPSYEQLKQDTGADRKTVWQALKVLQEIGLIADSGERKGKTQQVIVWRLNITENGIVPKTESLNDSENGTVTKTEQFLFSAETVPFLDSNSSKNGIRNLSITNQNKPTTTTESGSGSFENLIYPPSLSTEERQAASKLLANCNGKAQAILDTLSAAIQAKEIKKTPLSYLGGLVRKYQAGDFDDGAAISIADKRAKKTARETIIQNQYVVSNEDVLRQLEALQKKDKVAQQLTGKSSQLIAFKQSLKLK